MARLVGMFKINIHLFTAEGPEAVRKIGALGPGVFLDLKYHDIPNTVAGAISAAAELPEVRFLDLHASGGAPMMRAAVQALAQHGGKVRAKLLGITILTSLDEIELRRVGFKANDGSGSFGPGATCQKMRAGWRSGLAKRGEADPASLRAGFPDRRPRNSAGASGSSQGRRPGADRDARRGDSSGSRLSRGGTAHYGGVRSGGGGAGHRAGSCRSVVESLGPRGLHFRLEFDPYLTLL